MSRAPLPTGWHGTNAGATPALAAGAMDQSMAWQLSPLAMGQFGSAIDSGDKRDAICGRPAPQRSRCASRSLVGSSGQSPQNGRVRALSPPAEALCSQLERWNHSRAALELCEDGQWWATSDFSAMRSMASGSALPCRTRFLLMVCQQSAARMNALNELDTLHTSDQYDLMCGVRRGQRGEERA